MSNVETATIQVNEMTVEYVAVGPVGAVCPECGAERGYSCKGLPLYEYHPGALEAAAEATVQRGERLRQNMERQPSGIFSEVVRVY